MLAAQYLVEDLHLATNDEIFRQYGVKTIQEDLLTYGELNCV